MTRWTTADGGMHVLALLLHDTLRRGGLDSAHSSLDRSRQLRPDGRSGEWLRILPRWRVTADPGRRPGRPWEWYRRREPGAGAS